MKLFGLTGKKIATSGLVVLLAMMMRGPLVAGAATITYYDLDFEGGSSDFGGGVVFAGGSPTNVSPSNLDGRALDFGLSDQLRWNRNNVDSTTHRVAFDYFAEPGANITQFLDVPSILRLDVSTTGRHHVEVLYDLSAKTAVAFLDGVQDNNLLTILAFPAVPASTHIRIGNQFVSPGDSTGGFQIDNLVWQGNVDFSVVPLPAAAWMGIIMLGGLSATQLIRRRRTAA